MKYSFVHVSVFDKCFILVRYDVDLELIPGTLGTPFLTLTCTVDLESPIYEVTSGPLRETETLQGCGTPGLEMRNPAVEGSKYWRKTAHSNLSLRYTDWARGHEGCH